MTINLHTVTEDTLQQELLRRSQLRTVEAIDRAEATLEALQKKHQRQSEERRRLCRRIAAATKQS